MMNISLPKMCSVLEYSLMIRENLMSFYTVEMAEYMAEEY
nr:MAG TPA: hypothetical protein [Caudoviricetes sp.]